MENHCFKEKQPLNTKVMDLEFECVLSIWFDEVTGLCMTGYFALVRECQPFSRGLLDTLHYVEIKAQQLLKWTILI